jgi:hypothetical protein
VPQSGDGASSRVGTGENGKGFNVNVAWNNDDAAVGGGPSACGGDADYLLAWQEVGPDVKQLPRAALLSIFSLT